MSDLQRDLPDTELPPELTAAIEGRRDDVICLPFEGRRGDLDDLDAANMGVYAGGIFLIGSLGLVAGYVEGLSIPTPLLVSGLVLFTYFLWARVTHRLYPRFGGPFRGDETRPKGLYLLPDALLLHHWKDEMRRTTVIPRRLIQRVRFGNEEGRDIGLNEDLLVTVDLPEGIEDLRIPELQGRRANVEDLLNDWFGFDPD